MPEVTLKSVVPYGGNTYKAGEKIDVPEEQAKAWGKMGLLHEGGGPTEQQHLQRQIERAAARNLAVGRQGRLLGSAPDVEEPEAEVRREFVFLPVTPQQYEKLQEKGWDDPETLRTVTDEQLEELGGFGEVSITKIRAALAR